MQKKETKGAMVFRFTIYFLTFALIDKFQMHYSFAQTLADASAWTMITFGVIGLFSDLREAPEEMLDKDSTDQNDG